MNTRCYDSCEFMYVIHKLTAMIADCSLLLPVMAKATSYRAKAKAKAKAET